MTSSTDMISNLVAMFPSLEISMVANTFKETGNFDTALDKLLRLNDERELLLKSLKNEVKPAPIEIASVSPPVKVIEPVAPTIALGLEPIVPAQVPIVHPQVPIVHPQVIEPAPQDVTTELELKIALLQAKEAHNERLHQEAMEVIAKMRFQLDEEKSATDARRTEMETRLAEAILRAEEKQAAASQINIDPLLNQLNTYKLQLAQLQGEVIAAVNARAALEYQLQKQVEAISLLGKQTDEQRQAYELRIRQLEGFAQTSLNALGLIKTVVDSSNEKIVSERPEGLKTDPTVIILESNHGGRLHELGRFDGPVPDDAGSSDEEIGLGH